MKIADLCKEINNWFQTSIHMGNFQIVNGRIDLPFLQNGQYFRIMGSVFNDGVYKYNSEEEQLQDEEFHGAIWPMAIPKAVLDLQEEIEAWEQKYFEQINSPFQSESFGGYSYSKASGSGDGEITWQSQFKQQLNRWRKLKP